MMTQERAEKPASVSRAMLPAMPGTKRSAVPLLRPDEQRAWLESLMQSVDNAIIGKSLDGTIRMWSVGAERLYGYGPGEALGRSVEMIVPEDRRSELEPIFARLRRGEAVEPFETVRLRKDGARRWVSVTISPVTDASGTVIGAWTIARDITSHRVIERELRRAKDAAELANQAKDRFLAVLSHELRTPLTPVLAAAQALSARDDVPDDVRRTLGIVKRNVELESRLIDDLLDLTRISRGKLTLEIEPSDAAALLRDAVEICDETLRAKRLGVRMEIGPGPHVVRADAARLRQVLWNLLQNAAKFTPAQGEITVRCCRSGGDVVLEVEDQGAGIDPARLPTIFGAFEQGHTEDGGRSQGLGLGLAICQSLVQLHRGSIEARSEGRGKGAAFTVRLPSADGQRPAPKPERTTPQAEEPDKRLRILLVEDHEDTALLLKGLLERRGYDVTTAATVREGVDRATEIDPDLIVSDLGLPDGTGIDLLRGVRDAGVEARAIALSGYGMDEDVRRSTDAGFADHLVKPVGIKRLLEAVRGGH